MRRSVIALCLLVGCTRSSDPRLYTLVAEQSRTTYPPSVAIEVRRPSIAGYLDRREIVLGVAHDQLELSRAAHWAEPLDAMIGRVLAADLALRLPNSRVFSDLGSLAAVPEARVDVEIQRFDRGSDGLVLRALVALRRAPQSASVQLEAIALTQPVSEGDTDAVVRAMNVLLGQLADKLAQALATLPQPAPEHGAVP
jgi:uncharacterized protein